MPKERFAGCIQYMKTIAQVDPAQVDSVCAKALALSKQTKLDELLKIPVGVNPKGNAASGTWRNAVRSLILLSLIADYRGAEPLSDFADSTRKSVLATDNNEQELQSRIRIKLASAGKATTGEPARYYFGTDTNAPSTTAFIGRGLPSGNARLSVPTGGLWMNCAYETAADRNHPYCVDFKEHPELVGIYTESATGGCVPIAFLYGLRNAPLEAITMWHTPGGGMIESYVEQMKFPAKPDAIPMEIVVYAYMNPIEFDGFGKNQIDTLKGWGYTAPRVTYYHDGRGVLAIDKWGRFGSLDAKVLTGKTKVTDMQTDGGWRGGEHYVVTQPRIDRL